AFHFVLLLPLPPPRSTLFPYTTLSRSFRSRQGDAVPLVDDLPRVARLRIDRDVAEASVDHAVDRSAAQERDIAAAAHAKRKLARSEEHTSELQSRGHLVCRLLLEKKKN